MYYGLNNKSFVSVILKLSDLRVERRWHLIGFDVFLFLRFLFGLLKFKVLVSFGLFCGLHIFNSKENLAVFYNVQ